MPVRSMTRPMIPPSASISRTRCPFAIPPIAGLHDICPTRSRFNVISPVSAPRRAAADAASQPAWPAPITITSNLSSNDMRLFPDTERCEDLRQYVFRRRLAGDLAQKPQSIMQRHEHKLFAVTIPQRTSRSFELALSAAQQIVVTSIRDQQAAVIHSVAVHARKYRST